MASITSITLPSNKTYGNQEILDFTVTFDDVVTITPDGADSVRIPITLDTGDTVFAVLQDTGAPSATYTFRYSVAEGNLDTNGIQLGTAIELVGNATIVDAVSVPATLTFPSIGDTTGILVDAVAPTITTLTVPPNGTYGVGQTLDFTVTFSEAVTLNPGTGTIQVPLILGTGETVYATLQGSGTEPNSYVFSYAIAEGNLDTDGIQVGETLELVGDATVTDVANNPATLTLATIPDTTGIIVDAVAPAITAVTVPTGGTYGVGQTLDFTVTFSEAVTLNPGTGAIQLPITLDSGETVYAELQGSGTELNSYVFSYTIAEGDVDTDGIQVGESLNVVGDATVTDIANNPATLTLANVPDTTGILVDTTAPTISTVLAPPTGTYGVGQTLNFTVVFSEAVTLNPGTGSIQVPLTLDNGEIVYADLQGSGAELNSYAFSYTITEGDLDTDGIQIGESLNVVGDATVTDAANNPATLTFANIPDTTGIIVDAVAPIITAVTAPSSGTYGVGQTLDFTVTFNEAVTLNPGTGAVQLPLILGTGEPVYAELQGSGTEPNSYVFSYAIAEGDVDTDGIQVGESLQLVGDATVTDAANNVATTLAFTTIPDTTGVIVDAVAPTITAVTVPASGTYGVGQTLDFTVTFSEAVTLNAGTGSIQLPITLDSGETVYAELQGSGTELNSYVFSYTIAEGDVDTDGIQVGESLEIMGDATVTDIANNPATLALTNVPDTTGVIVDAVAPTITTITLPANGTYGAGQTLDFTLTFSEAVTLNPGTSFIQLPITLDSGEPLVAALQGPGTEPNSYVFSYTVAEGNIDTNGIEVGTTLELGADATITDAANNTATLTIPTSGDTSGIIVDAVAPTITAVGLPANDTYSVGETLDFTVTFDEAVTLNPGTGAITLPITLDSGETVSAALQGPGIETNTYVFQYTVAEGDSDTNGIQVGTALTLEGDATVTDAANNPAALTLPEVGDTTGIVVDAVAPEVTAIAPPSDGIYGLGEVLEFTLTFSEVVNVDTTAGTPGIPLTIGSEVVDAGYISGSATNALVFGYTIQEGDEDPDGIEFGSDLNLNGGTILDLAGNAALLALDPDSTPPIDPEEPPIDDPINGEPGDNVLVGTIGDDSLLGGGIQVNSGVIRVDDPAPVLQASQGFTLLTSPTPGAGFNSPEQLIAPGISAPLELGNSSELTAFAVPVTIL